MRTLQLFAAVTAVFCFFCFQSCKKSDSPAPVPPVVIMPDTLTTGWAKQVFVDPTVSGSGYSDIFFNSSTSGYLASSNGLYKSTDGGINWTKLNSTTINWSNIFVTNDSKAFFVGQNGVISKTLDGGSSFVNFPVGDLTSDIFFTDNNIGYCITSTGLYTTTDAGLTWVKLVTPGLSPLTSTYSSLSFANATTGWIISGGTIFRSVGSNLNWQMATITGATPASQFQSVFATSATNIYAANSNAEIFRSTDGGVNFSFIKKLDDAGFTDIHFISDLVGYACAGRTVYKTTDGAVSWSKVVSLGQGSLVELHFTDATHGWACGSDGIVLIFR
jgi:photosystem II stability/assembly factor-like uncharacterized protein